MSDPQESTRLPEGVINAEPAGGWESGHASDTEADHGAHEPSTPVASPDGADVEQTTPTAPAGPIDDAQAGRGADPDLSGDADLEQGRGADAATDPSARERQEGL